MTLPTFIGRGRAGLAGNESVRLRKSISGMITLAKELKTDHNALLAKLDADAGVTDTNYAALHGTAAADPTALSRMFGNGGTATHGSAAKKAGKSVGELITLANELRVDHNGMCAKLDADGTVALTTYVSGNGVTSAAGAALRADFGEGSTGFQGREGAQLRAIVKNLVILLNELKTKHNAVLAKLDTDAGVTDTNYAATCPITSADAG